MIEIEVSDETYSRLEELKELLEEEYELSNVTHDEIVSYLLHKIMYREIEVDIDVEEEE